MIHLAAASLPNDAATASRDRCAKSARLAADVHASKTPKLMRADFSIFKGIEDAKILVGKCGREIFRLAISYGYVDVFPLDDLNRSGFA